MKSLLLFFALCFFCINTSAQINTFTTQDTSFHDWSSVVYWSLGVLPNSSHDVVISAGSKININQHIFVKSMTVQNNATVKLESGHNVTLLNPSTFAAGSTFNWMFGYLKGGSTLNLNGTTNLTGGNHKFISDNTTLNNSGTLNISDVGYLYLSNGTLNNLSNGTIHLQSSSGSVIERGTITNPNILYNTGTIRKTGTGVAQISVQMNSNAGTFNVESGTLALNSQAKYLTNGIYNVDAGAQLNWNCEVVCDGTLTGVLDGALFCSTSSTKILPSTTATFDFTGTTGVNWSLYIFKNK